VLGGHAHRAKLYSFVGAPLERGVRRHSLS
jgi:hypothetical protein